MELDGGLSSRYLWESGQKAEQDDEDAQISACWKSRFISIVPLGTEWLGLTYLSLSATGWDCPVKAVCLLVRQVFAWRGGNWRLSVGSMSVSLIQREPRGLSFYRLVFSAALSTLSLYGHLGNSYFRGSVNVFLGN